MKAFSPQRSVYNHKYSSNRCPFCDEIIIEKQNIKKLEGKHWMVFVNQYPILDGNLMLVSKKHLEDTSELGSEEWLELKDKLEQLKEITKSILNTKSFNIGYNIGPNSGSSVKHLHVQFIPRADSTPAQGFAGLIANIHTVKLSPDQLKEKINKHLK